MELLNWNVLSERGLIMRINREIMHPIGLAVCRELETGRSSGALVAPSGQWRYPDDLHCGKCNSQRRGETCWKCDGPLHAPTEEWVYPDLPPVDRIRELARELDYAIGEHGSKERDLDLIAVPWGDRAKDYDAYAVAHHIAEGLLSDGKPAQVVNFELKPHGRVAFSIQMSGWYKLLDLSVCPTI